MMNKYLNFAIKIAFICVLVTVIILARPEFSKSQTYDSFTNVKNTLSNPRLSFSAAVGTGNTAGTTALIIDTNPTPAWATSKSNHNLFPGDTLMIGDNIDYEVENIIDDANDNQIIISRSGGLDSGDITPGSPVIATRSAQHTVQFTVPGSSIYADGAYRVRLKGTAAGAANMQDGLPDPDGFDFRESFNTSWINCSSADSGTPTIEYGGSGNCPSGWICVYCSYSGNNTTGSKTIGIGTTAVAQQPINPAPSSTTKTLGVADTYTFYIEHLDSTNAVKTLTAGRIAVIESVRVTATIDPTITFSIASVGTGVTACETSLDVTTTATTVPYGSLSIGSFNDAAHQLSCVTNASGGYVVTAIENDALSINGDGLVTIADTDCDAGSCVYNSEGAWTTDNNTSGFGYSIHNINANEVAFSYGGTGNFAARPFANETSGESPEWIMRNTSLPTITESIYVCYRLTVSTVQQAGFYENAVTYRATATF